MFFINLFSYYQVKSAKYINSTETIIPDYRRVNSPFGGEDAVFPSGGDDLSVRSLYFTSKMKANDFCQAVFIFLQTLYESSKRSIFVLGNSAGGVHLSTFLLHPKYLTQRQSLLSPSSPLQWKGAINLGIPAHFDHADLGRLGMLSAYFGSKDEIKERCACGLLSAASKIGSREESFVPETLVSFHFLRTKIWVWLEREEYGTNAMQALVSEWDPAEIAQTMQDFTAFWEKTWSGGIEFRTVVGHNHISPPLVLMSGEGEEWGEDVVFWIKKRST